MTIVRSTEVWNIKTRSKKMPVLLLKKQDNGLWMASVYFKLKGVVTTHHESSNRKDQAYAVACNWVFSNLDSEAIFSRVNRRPSEVFPGLGTSNAEK